MHLQYDVLFTENPLTCNCESQELWKWMQDHYKIVLKRSSNLRCEHPDELHGYSFIELTSEKLCDTPIVVRIAIQDIQTYSVIVSWQSRNQTGLSGYQVAYFAEVNPAIVSIKWIKIFRNSSMSVNVIKLCIVKWTSWF